MKQSRATSFFKSLISTVAGFGVAMVANALVLPLFGYTPSLSENFLITCIYTVISIARGYALERLFEAAGWRTRMSAFALAVLAERQRQIAVEGYSTQHDDEHSQDELLGAAASYLLDDPGFWPWHPDDFKPSDGARRSLVKGAALALAAGERFDRNRKRKPQPGMVSGYQPSEGPRPKPPSTGSGVVPQFAHGKSAREHAGPSQ